MALFDGHLKCARCRDKGVGDDRCVLKKDFQSARHLPQSRFNSLSPPPTEIGRTKTRRFLPLLPILMDPLQVSVLGWVDGEKAIKKPETPAGKKKITDNSPKPSSKKKSSSKPRSDKLRDLDEK